MESQVLRLGQPLQMLMERDVQALLRLLGQVGVAGEPPDDPGVLTGQRAPHPAAVESRVAGAIARAASSLHFKTNNLPDVNDKIGQDENGTRK